MTQHLFNLLSRVWTVDERARVEVVNHHHRLVGEQPQPPQPGPHVPRQGSIPKSTVSKSTKSVFQIYSVNGASNKKMVLTKGSHVIISNSVN